MTHPKKRRWARREASVSLRNRSSIRCPAVESLEQRILLTIVTSVSPPANALNADVSTDVVATFDQDVTAATPQTFVVHGTQSRGQLLGTATSVVTLDRVATHNPTHEFFPGETVHVTVTSGVTTAGGSAIQRSWQFRTESTGSGQFVDSGQVLGAFESADVEFGDLDGDGDLDSVHGGNLIWLNDGSGIFTNTGQSLSAGNFDLGDLDGDGDFDVVGLSTVWLNDGSGVFINSGQDLLGGLTVEAGDIDGDGDLDVMQGVAYAGNRVWVNNGSGTFTNTGQSLGNSATSSIQLGDLDGDGDVDAFAVNNGPNNRVWLNDGNGVFTDSTQALGGFRASLGVVLGDLDGDGDLDAVVGNNTQQIATRVWFNDGSGVFSESAQVINNNQDSWTTEVGDMDGDGDLDLFIGGGRDPSVVWLNDGAGEFSDSGQRLIFPTTGTRRARGVDLGDVDGDGDLDAWESSTATAGGRLWINQNLTPNVTLTIDNPTIEEASGTATITATLSATHTDAVTIELGISGTAIATDDYTVSDTQIVIPIGSTSGSITVTAVQDTVDDDDETVIVDITGVSNGQESGTQQATITILDDDEPVEPSVTLTVEGVDAAINYEMSGDFPGSNPILASMGVDLGPFTGTFALDSTGDPVVQTADISVTETSLGGTLVFLDSEFEVTAAETIQVTSFFPAALSVFGFDTHLDVTLVFASMVDLSAPLPPLVSGTVDIAVVVPGLGRVGEPGVVSELNTVPASSSAIAEADGAVQLIVILSETTTVPVTVELGFSGTASDGTDYTASGTQIVIEAGETNGTISITAVDDALDEPDETLVVDIIAVTNGIETSEQQQTITIVDDDEPPTFMVASLVPTTTGFVAELNAQLDASVLNLYDTQTSGAGPADAVLTGATVGEVSGSLVVDPSLRKVTFIKTGGTLAADNYTVTLRSAANGFKDLVGNLLDGDGDGTVGDDFSNTFVVPGIDVNVITVSLLDFVRGPGQDVNLPADSTLGIPLTISNGMGVRNGAIELVYDPTFLDISGATVGANMPNGATVTLDTSVAGTALLVFSSPSDLPVGSNTLINLQAIVPSTSEIRGSQQVVDVRSAVLSTDLEVELPVIDDDALHVVSYFADLSGNGRVNASDAAQVARFAALIEAGFSGSLLTDPIVVGDVSGNGRVNAADASLVARFAALIDVPQIPQDLLSL